MEEEVEEMREEEKIKSSQSRKECRQSPKVLARKKSEGENKVRQKEKAEEEENEEKKEKQLRGGEKLSTVINFRIQNEARNVKKCQDMSAEKIKA